MVMLDDKDSTMDWNDLTSKSVPSLWGAIGNGGISTTSSTTRGQVPPAAQSWNRSIASLQVASQALLEQPGVAGNTIGFRSRLKSTIPITTGNDNNKSAGTSRGSSNGAKTAQAKSTEEAVAEHEENILQTLRNQLDEAIQNDANQVIDNSLQQSWERKHNQWLEEISVGGRHKKTNGNNLMTDATNTYAPTGSESSMGRYGGSASVRSSISVISRQDGRDTQLDPQLIRSHGLVVQDLPRLLPADAARRFGSLVMASKSSPTTTTITQPSFRGYATAWNWMTRLLEYQQRHSGYNRSTMTSGMDAIDRAIATVIHFCDQFHTEMDQAIKAAIVSGQTDLIQDTYKDPVAKNCQAFSKLFFGSTTTTTTETVSTTMPWHILYFCMRCGSGSAALEVWQTSQSMAQISNAVATSIEKLLIAMEPWGELARPPQLPQTDRRTVADYLESLQQQQASLVVEEGGNGGAEGRSPPSVHQIGFLALLSGTGNVPIASTEHGFKTIEDFLFARISHALLQRDPVQQLAELGKSIQGYGSSYFGDSESGGWAYSLPLLMTQQYSKALTHLVEDGFNLGLFQATHLGLLLSSSSIELEDLGQPNEDEDLASSLLVAYAGRLVAEPTAGSLAALEYLALIPRRDRKRKEVATLIAKTGDLQRLVGGVDENGMRYGGESLNSKFSKQDVVALLRDAAEMILRDSHGDDLKMGTAAMCFMLAGRYDNVLRLLCDMLYPPNEDECGDSTTTNNTSTSSIETSASRQFWMNQTKQFHQFYLERRTHVMEVLEREQKLHLIQTSRLMMQLNIFFQLLKATKYFEAWRVACETKLLPVDRNDMSSKQELYRSGLDDTIKRSFPSFLVGAMQSLIQQHTQTKRQQQQMSRSNSDGVAAQRLVELKNHASLLVVFGGTLGIASDRMSRLEAMMM